MSRRALLGLSLATLTGGLAWWTLALAVAPFAEHERTDRAECVSLTERIKLARGAIEEVRKLEIDATAARRQIDQFTQEIPPGSATIWLPDLIKDHFSNFGLSNPLVRMSGVREVPDLPGFHRGYWSIGAPIAETGRSGAGAFLAVAELEQQHPLIKVLNFTIRPNPENPEERVAMFNVSAFIRK